ncbi:MAG: MaoC/PaaZ C-terminal domain-containing protein [Aquabacterium sp.]
MISYQPQRLLPGTEPGAWSAPLPVTYDQRDVLLYAVGIGCTALPQVWEGAPGFAVFPTFPIRWGGRAVQLDEAALPPSPGPLTLDAERHLMQLAPLPLAGTVQVRSRLLSVQPRPRGSAFLEFETEVTDAGGQVCTRMVSGSFRRGVRELGDIAPFQGAGTSRSVKLEVPARDPDLRLSVRIPETQAHVYRLSGDYNPLHIDPAAARFGGFDAPILHGLCTFGHCGQMLLGALAGGDAARFGALKLRFSSPVIPGDTVVLRAWEDGPGRLLFQGQVGDRVVVNNAFFEYR